MARMARRELLYDGCYAHIISRSIRKIRLMRDDADFQMLNQLLMHAKRRYGFRVHHYCLMQTHFHLVVSMPDVEAFSRAIQFVKSQYCYHVHARYRLSGPVWRERFRALLIENEPYLYVCGRYVENNPVKAGLVREAKGWKYSSWGFYHEERIDPLISRLDFWDRTAPVETGDDPQKFCEKGKVIGSPFFKFQFYRRMKQR